MTVTPQTLWHAILDTLLAEKVQSRQHAIPVFPIHIPKHFCILNTCFTPRFKRKDWKFVAPAWQKLATPISPFFFLMAHVREVAFWGSTKISWIRTTWVSCALGQGNCNIHASAHTYTYAHFPACSLYLTSHYHALHCHAHKAMFWNTTESNTELNHIYTLLNQNLYGP